MNEARTLMTLSTLAATAWMLGFGAPAAAAPKGGGGGSATTVVWVVNDEGIPYEAPTYLPPCAAKKAAGKTNYGVVFERHDLCATVTTSTGSQLTDDVVIQVTTTKGYITSIQLRGQDVIGEEGIMHESEVWPITPPFKPTSASFTLHVHAEHLPIWRLSDHLGGERVEMVGTISLGDLVYASQ